MRTLDKVLMENAKRLADDAARMARGERVLRHIPTGFASIDNKFGGVRLGVATELISHTGDGKSSFLRQTVEAGAKSGAGVLWFVAEDPEDATMERQLAGDTNIDCAEIGRIDLDASQLNRIEKAATSAGEWGKRVLPVFGSNTVDDVLKKIDDTTSIGGAPLLEVVIDYAQVLGESRNLEEDIARLGIGLQDRSRVSDTNKRALASLVATQVTNDVLRTGRDWYFKTRDIARVRPSVGDEEWCRRLGKLCKAAWALVRPGRWLIEFGDTDAVDDYAELHVIKANFGPLGWAELSWNGPQCRFGDK